MIPLHLHNTYRSLKIYLKAPILNGRLIFIRSQGLDKNVHHWFNINDLKGTRSDRIFMFIIMFLSFELQRKIFPHC